MLFAGLAFLGFVVLLMMVVAGIGIFRRMWQLQRDAGDHRRRTDG